MYGKMEQNVVKPDAKTLGMIEKTLASPAVAFMLFPEQPLPGETVTPPPLPAAPPRALPANYVSGSQNLHWTDQMRQSPRPVQRSQNKFVQKPQPPFVSSPSGKWKMPLVADKAAR
mmetsp:Transcript_50948/g.101322  ORF Transcript_50948/g.101322 Transcript_50948/m.101322 type:complete len:116 (-) Transcript_50948:529-876(-)